MKLLTFLFLFILYVSQSALASGAASDKPHQYPDVWSRLFTKPSEHIQGIELVTEGLSIKKAGYEPEVFIHVKSATGSYKFGFFSGQKTDLYGQDDTQKEYFWHQQHASAYQDSINLRTHKNRFDERSISINDGSYLDGNSAIFNENGDLLRDMLSVSFPYSCMWIANNKPLSRVLHKHDFEYPQYIWQKYIIFQSHHWVNKSIPSNALEAGEIDTCANHSEKKKGLSFHTQTSIKLLLDLKDGTILVAGEQFVVRLKIRDGQMSIPNPYIRIVDAKEVSQYLDELEKYQLKNQPQHSQDEKSWLNFWNKYFIYADQLVYQKWFQNK